MLNVGPSCHLTPSRTPRPDEGRCPSTRVAATEEEVMATLPADDAQRRPIMPPDPLSTPRPDKGRCPSTRVAAAEEEAGLEL
jgi:hypothetical protein